MNGGDIAAIIGGITAFVGTIYGTWRGARSDKVKSSSDNAAVLLGGWEKFQTKTLEEVERVRKSCQDEIAALKVEHEQDRAEWRGREKSMQDEIDKLKSQVLILIQAKARGE
ncbi:hypothetical protein [Iamia sp.]|uniref:hypothetical protein n=1 Tax=Iamia sp. TaxID=2722710 RepID=UPI002D095B78|nr:hypothetical protein [Iamia sp.]HXH59092.1 hypothetical protein [Iamia sp.]